MSELAILNQKVLLSLTESERKYYELSRHGKVSQVDENTAYKSIYNSIKAVHAKAGQLNGSEEDFAVLANMLLSEVLKHYPNASLLEISEAMNNGVVKKYGNYFGLNIVTFMEWIGAFMEDEKRKESLLKADKLLAERPEKPKTEDELKQIAEESIKTMIEHYKKTKQVINIGNSNFTYLWQSGQIKFGKEQADKYLQQATLNVLARLNGEMAKAKDNGLKEEVKKIQLEIESLQSKDMQIRIEAGNLALIDWMASL